MPSLNLQTNVSLEAIDVSSILSQIISSCHHLEPRLSHVMVSLEGSIPISFGGREEAAAYGEFVAIGVLNPQIISKLTAAIASILESNLSVPKSRFYLKFYDIEGFNCGLNIGTIMVVESN